MASNKLKMIKYINILIFISILGSLSAQTYNIATNNGQTINTCSGNFYDSGGPLSNYGDNENYSITFCSDNGTQISITLSSSAIQNGDYLYVYYGDVATGTPNLTNPGAGLITSPCQCITFVFISNSSTTKAGWAGTISCGTPPALSNDFLYNAIIPPLNGTCLTGQTNVGATADYTYQCFASGNTVWYELDLTAGSNTIDVTLQNAAFANVEYLLVFGDVCSSPSDLTTYTDIGDQCGASANIVEWTDLTEGIYYLGVSSITEGTFDLCITESYLDVCGDFYCGPGEDCFSCPYDCGACPESIGGPYFHPTVGIQGTYLGMCLVNPDCSTTHSYYDNGGPFANYSNSINQIYRTFCPDEAGNCVQATINLLNIDYAGAGCGDWMMIQSGPTQNSDILWQGCGSTFVPTIETMAGSYNSGVFTSLHSSGCLTFRFYSGAITTANGWDISLSCVPCAYGPDGAYNYDCASAESLCDDISVSSEVWGPGLISEGCGGCVTSENFTEWFYFEVSTSGTMEMNLKPVGNSDVDFALYEASDCSSLGSPIRCSYAAYLSPGWTGMTAAAGDLSEDVTGDQWVAEVDIIAGQSYFLMINEWDKENPNSYTLDWILSNGASFDCTILPVELLNFDANKQNKNVTIKWATATESNNDYFTILKSNNGVTYKSIGTIQGAGNSNTPLQYLFFDEEELDKTTYYQLKQTDFDGNFSYSKVVAVSPDDSDELSKLSVGYDIDQQILNIMFCGDTDEKYKLEIFSITGQNVFNDIISTETNAWAQYRINTTSFQSGLYSLIIRSSDSVVSEKVTIIK